MESGWPAQAASSTSARPSMALPCRGHARRRAGGRRSARSRQRRSSEPGATSTGERRTWPAESPEASAGGEEIARSIALEAGKPITLARAEVRHAAETFTLAAAENRHPAQRGPTHRPRRRERGLHLRGAPGPRGRVVAISPFNFPLNLAAHKVAPALAVGAPCSSSRRRRRRRHADPRRDLRFGRRDAGRALGSPLHQRARREARHGSAGARGLVHRQRQGGLAPAREVGCAPGWCSSSAATRRRRADFDDADLELAAAAARPERLRVRGPGLHLGAADPGPRARPRGVHLGFLVARARARGRRSARREDRGRPAHRRRRRRPHQRVDRRGPRSRRQAALGGERKGRLIPPQVLADVPARRAARPRGGVRAGRLLDGLRRLDEAAFAAVNDSACGLQAWIFTHDLRRARRAAGGARGRRADLNDAPSFRSDATLRRREGLRNGSRGVRYAMDELTDYQVLVIAAR